MDHLHSRKSSLSKNETAHDLLNADFVKNYVDDYVEFIRQNSEKLELRFKKNLQEKPFEALAITVMIGVVIGRLLKTQSK